MWHKAVHTIRRPASDQSPVCTNLPSGVGHFPAWTSAWTSTYPGFPCRWLRHFPAAMYMPIWYKKGTVKTEETRTKRLFDVF